MQRQSLRKTLGFTLIEILLVLAIIGMIIFMMLGFYQQQTLQTRIDKTSQQMQQILNAGLAYFVNYGAWPGASGTNKDTSLSCLFGSSPCKTQFLVPTPGVNNAINSPWGTQYNMSWFSGNSCPTGTPAANASNCNLFYVFVEVNAGSQSGAIANSIAGKLPMGYTSSQQPPGNGNPPQINNACTPGQTGPCWAVAAVNIPGQNLNNASAVNFAGIYHHGGCVPAPSCPSGMTPEVMVVPASVSGFNSSANLGTNPDVYPISSFTAYATGDTSGKPTSNPGTCTGGTSPPCPTGTSASSAYWRACLQVVTETGTISSSNTNWGDYVSLLAITRCAISGESSGSSYSATSLYGPP